MIIISADESTFGRLEDQIQWYSKKSQENQKYFKRLKVTEIIAAALIPLAAGISVPVFILGCLGVFIVILEGIQSLYQYQHNWITYRSTAEALKHEKYLYLAGAGPYLCVGNAAPLLAERVESLISREHARWVFSRENVIKEKGDTCGTVPEREHKL